jgi:RHS repeat-associated protein
MDETTGPRAPAGPDSTPAGRAQSNFAVVPPTVTLPKGGGAIRGLGEKFGANPVTGTGSMSIPIATSPGRSGFGPQLALSYDSGTGNGPFGFGWSLSVPSITRKTDKGLPQYLDGVDSDVFILSGAEDLVPEFEKDAAGRWVLSGGKYTVHEKPRTLDGVTYTVRRYRPRIEGLFARIERWTNTATGDMHWRSISRDNVTTVYGKDNRSRIVDPADPDTSAPTRVFSWLICGSYDDKGNAILYEYAAENDEGVDPGLASERNRLRAATRYLKRITYGNRVPNRDLTTWQASDPARLPHDTWMFEVVFDYGEPHYTEVDLDPARPADEQHRFVRASALPEMAWNSSSRRWAVRPDAFSSHRAGFEVRTHRRCRRILMFHHIPDLPTGERGYEGLVRSTEFDYGDLDYRQPVDIEIELAHQGSTRFASFIRGVTQSGYVRTEITPGGPTDGAGYGMYLKKSLPPVEFEYSKAVIQDRLFELGAESVENLPVGLDGSIYQWVDLNGEGVSGILTEQAGAWFYKPNLGGGAFGPVEQVPTVPSLPLRGGGQQLLDLAGDGQLDLVSLSGPLPGFFERTNEEGWEPFRTFRQLPNIRWDEPNLRFIDLDGDGHADILITEQDVFTWHPSLGEQGFGAARNVPQSRDEERGTRLVLADGTDSIYIADMCGDGLTDLVRIRNGEVCYWPNLGYGRFGPKVTMDNAPWFDHPDQFDQQRIRLTDIDGSGTNDVIYLAADGVRLYFNQSGNRLSDPRPLTQAPPIDNMSTVMPADFLGNGTACLVWSSPLPGHGRRPVRYVDLMGGTKPHLLIKTVNNLGAETQIHYAASTSFYLADKRAGRPWLTRLPFPVHVVDCVETFDHISRNRFVTRYAYHHGYFDGQEREFRGFGMVEQWDTEQIGALTVSGTYAKDDNTSAGSHVPPVRTRTWFHTGVDLGRDHVSDYFAGLLNNAHQGEYFREPGLTDTEARALLLADTVLPTGLTREEEREACRALKGAMLRQEVYADDAGPGATPDQIQRARTPYTVTEQNFSIRALQPAGSKGRPVFFSHAHEAISFHYERNPGDPRIQHALTLEVDAYGNVLKEAAIAYGRRTIIRVLDAQGHLHQVPNPGLVELTSSDRGNQTTTLLTYTQNRVSNATESADTHRNPLLCEAVTFELTGYMPTGAAGRYQASDFVEPDLAAPGRLRHKFAVPEVAYEATGTGSQRRRPIQWLRTLYRRDDLRALLPLGELHALALPGESYKLAFTPGLLAKVFQRPRGGQPLEALLADPPSVLGGEAGNRGGYLRSQTLKADGRFPARDADDHWWIPSGISSFTTNAADSAATELAEARQHFFLPRRYRDPFGQDAFVDFDAYDLLNAESRDALGNRVRMEVSDYRVLQPRVVSDPNRNRTEVAFDALGIVVGTAVMGKALPAPVEGDSLTGFVADLMQAQLDAFFDGPEPHAIAPALLQGATTRIVYEAGRFRRSQQANRDDPTHWHPAYIATSARETHVSASLPPQGLKIQLSFSHSDGYGREIQKKIQAEPGAAVEGGPARNPRWVGSGWTIFNNKGKPVRQYEPFFSPSHRFEFAVSVGVSPVLFYDPAERVIATLHPNHTFEKAVFDPWHQTAYDVNDTCSPLNAQTGDPRTDPDIHGFVARYFAGQPASPAVPAWKTWQAQRIGGVLGPHEQTAATRAAAHADTPTTAHFDALGRPFLTVERNRVSCAGHDLDATEEALLSRVELDIEGNQCTVRDAVQQAHDALGRIVMRYAYDMLGNRIHQQSMEAGARWMLPDVAGKPLRAWDSRGHSFVTTYDALRRPVEQYVHGTTGDSDPRTLNRDILVDKIEYGEGVANAEALNLRTRIHRHFDSAGVATNARLHANGNPIEAYDFKGNLLRSTRRLVSDYHAIPDWLLNPPLEEETFEGSTRYDALNRPIQSIAPHSSVARAKRHVVQSVFNEANLLERVDVWLERAAEPAALLDRLVDVPSPIGIANIAYNARGQRRRIDYKNGASTLYDYDPLTFRLTHLYTRRGAAFTEDCDNAQPPPPTVAAHDQPPEDQSCGLQNLHYVYDPVGNIAHIQDDAQQTIYFRNQRAEPSNDYTYDSLYRLIQASGREHLGQQAAGDRNPPTAPDAFNMFHTRQDHPNVLKAMGTYIERYVYDAVGNFLEMQHRGSDPAHAGWTRGYTYAVASLIEDGSGGASLKTSNRLSHATLNPNGAEPQVESYQHDAHGNIVRMPHLGGALPGPNTHWDYRDHLRQTDLGGGGVAFYVYDASGLRLRKVWEKSGGRLEERIYLGGLEIFRKHDGPIGANTAALERETLHVVDDRQRVAMVERRTLDTAGADPAPARLIRHQFGNHLHSASLELDHEAQVISYEEYAPYGSSTYQAVRSKTETPKRYRHTARERDEESGLSYHDARYYAPWLGRWCSCDPEWLVDGVNLYRYARCNPVLFTDPGGTQAGEPAHSDSSEPRNFTTYEAYRAANPDKSDEAVRQLWYAEHGKKYLIIYDSGNDEFKRQATQAAKDHKTVAYSVDAKKLGELIKKNKPDVIMSFGHGITSQISTGSGEWIGEATLRPQLKAAAQKQDVRFVAEACSAGKEKGLMDSLQANTDLKNYSFASHTSVGHVTRNSDIRISGGPVLSVFLRNKLQDEVRVTTKAAAERVAGKILRSASDNETLPASNINTVLREVSVLGFEHLWELIRDDKIDVKSDPTVLSLNLSPAALARFASGIDEFRDRYNKAIAKEKIDTSPIKHHLTEIR